MRRGEANMKVVLRTNERSRCRPSKGWRLITAGVVKSVGSGELLGSHRLLSGHLRPSSGQQQVQQPISLLLLGNVCQGIVLKYLSPSCVSILGSQAFYKCRALQDYVTQPLQFNVGEQEIKRGVSQLQLGCQCH